MSAIHQMLVASGGVVSTFTAWDVWSDAAPASSATSTLSFGADGSALGTASPSDAGGTPGSVAWFLPLTSAIGANYWIKFTATSGTLTANTASTFTSLASAQSCSKNASASSATTTVKVEIATDSGGTNIVFTSTGNLLRYQHTL